VETRIALIGIVVENRDSVEKLNSILHEYGEFIIGRMGIPYPKCNVSVISVVLDAPTDTINALSGKLGMVPHVNIKTVYSKIPSGLGQ
jgi:putative iron-only hydrogenase system regulator